MPTMITGARSLIDAPSVAPRGGGILSVANVIPVSDPHNLIGAEYLTDACIEGHTWAEWCTMTPAGRKVFDAPELVQGDPFAVYSGVECMEDLPALKARAERRLAYTEGGQVDLHVWQQLIATAAPVGTGPYPVGEGIGLLEGALGAVYAGPGTLVASYSKVASAACCGNLITRNLDGSLTTIQGTPIANVTGDPEAPEPEDFMFITGQITLLQGPVVSFAVPQQVSDDGTYSPMRALAERIYVPLIECTAFKTEVTCS